MTEQKKENGTWTALQRRAMDSDSGNILVAASAGSGKTAVLTERILSHIFPEDKNREPVDVNRMLVITFTDDAASEMKRRIEKKFRDKGSNAEKDCSDEIFRQQTLLTGAHISTLHSFCKSICDQYPAESGIPKNASVLGEKEKQLYLRNCFDEVMEEYYGSKDLPEELFKICVGDSSDDDLFETVKIILEKAESYPEKVKWICESFERGKADPDSPSFGNDENFRILTDIIKEHSKAALNMLEKCTEKAMSYGMDKFRVPKLESYCDRERRIISSAEGSGSYLERLCKIKEIFKEKYDIRKSDRCPDESIKEEFEIARKSIDSFMSAADNREKKWGGILPDDPETLKSDLKKTNKAADALRGIVINVLIKYTERKRNDFVLDFSDMESGALRVLAKRDEEGNFLKDGKGDFIPSDIAGIYRELFKEVYVDEYQDINKVQDIIIKLVSRTDTDCPNLFTVGDIKQSIYGFRGSDPELFLEKEASFDEEKDLTCASSGELIRLNKNFRSRSCVIRGVNDIFNIVMNEETSGFEYKGKEELSFGAVAYGDGEEEQKGCAPCEYILEKPETVIPDRIKKLIKSGFEVTVEEKGKAVRKKLSYGHIAVLCYKNAFANRIVRALRDAGIPAVSKDGDTNLTECEDVASTLDYLRLLENPKNDRMLYSVLRSGYWNYGRKRFTESDFLRIRLKGEYGDTFYDACMKMKEEDSETGRKVRDFFETLKRLRKTASSSGLSGTVRSILSVNSFYSRHRRTGGEALQKLYFQAQKFEERYDSGLYSFVNFINNRENTESWSSGGGGEDAVKVMTVHKSKGLEFPIVFFCLDGKKNNTVNFVSVSDDRIGIKKTHREMSYTQHIAELLNDEKENRESFRVLYVALTRARERLYCICDSPATQLEKAALCSGMTNDKDILRYILMYNGSISYKLLCSALKCEEQKTGNWDVCEKYVPEAEEEEDSKQDEESSETGGEEDAEDMGDTGASCEDTGASCEDAGASENSDFGIPVKISVSEIKRLREEMRMVPEEKMLTEITDADPSFDFSLKEPDFGEEKHIDGKMRGTLIHTVLQYADFEKADMICRNFPDKKDAERELAEMLRETAESLPEDMMPDKNVLNQWDFRKLAGFFTGKYGERMRKGRNIRRETPFTLLMSWREITGRKEDPDVPVTVQGVIDCFFEEDGEIVIYDYKTDRVTEENESALREFYAPQLYCYTVAVERITGVKVRSAEAVFLSKC